MADPGKLSSTKIGVWRTCPMQYFLQYIEHQTVPASLQLVFGKEIHYLLQQFYLKNYRLAESFAATWGYRWRNTIAGTFLKGKERQVLETQVLHYTLASGDIIEIVVGNHVRFPSPDHQKMLEQYFSYKRAGASIMEKFHVRHKAKPSPLAMEKHFNFTFRGYPLTGVFDRLDMNKGKFYITDYKTDWKSPADTPFMLHTNPQFTLYSAAVQALVAEGADPVTYPRDADAIHLYHLRTCKLYETTRSPSDYDLLEMLCEDTYEGILKERFIPRYGYGCQFCSYQSPCSKYKVGGSSPQRMAPEDKSLQSVDEWLGWMDEEI